MKKKETWTITMRKKNPEDKVVEAFADVISWMECPHCKKTIFAGGPKIVGILEKLLKLSTKEVEKTRKEK